MKGAATLEMELEISRVTAPIVSIRCYVTGRKSDAADFRYACVTYFAASAFSIAAVTSGESGVTFGSNRATICPSRPTKNFVKFH